MQSSGLAAGRENSCGSVGGATRSVVPGRERRRMQYWSWLEGFGAAPKTPEQGPKKRKWCANADADLSSATKSERPAEEKQGRKLSAASLFGLYEEHSLYSRQAGLSVFEPWISRFPVKTAEVRAGSSRKPAGTPVLLFECGSGWYVDGVAAWVSRFSAVFVECIAFRQGDAQQYYRFHQLTKAEVEKVHGKDSSRKLFLWRFEHIVPVTWRQLRE